MQVIKSIYGEVDSIESIINEFLKEGKVNFLLGVNNEYQKVDIYKDKILITKKDKTKETINVAGLENILYYIFGYIKNNNILNNVKINKSSIDTFIEYISYKNINIDDLSKDEIISNMYELYQHNKNKLFDIISKDKKYFKENMYNVFNSLNGNEPFEKNIDIIKHLVKILGITQKDWNNILLFKPNENIFAFNILNNYFKLNLEEEFKITKSLLSYIITNYINLGIINNNNLNNFEQNILNYIYKNYSIYNDEIINIFLERNNIPNDINILNIFNNDNILEETKRKIIYNILNEKHKILLLKNNFDNKDLFFQDIINTLSIEEIQNNLNEFINIKTKLHNIKQKEIIDSIIIDIDNLENSILSKLSIENQIIYYIKHNRRLGDVLSIFNNNATAYQFLVDNYNFNQNSLELLNLNNSQFVYDVIVNNKIELDKILENIDIIIKKHKNILNSDFFIDIINFYYDTISQKLSIEMIYEIIHLLNDDNFIKYIIRFEDNEKIDLFIIQYSKLKDVKKVIKNLDLKEFKSSYYYKILNSEVPFIKVISLFANIYDKDGNILIEFLLKSNDNTILMFKDIIDYVNIDKNILFKNVVPLYNKLIIAYSKIDNNDNYDTILFFKPFKFLLDILGEFINEMKEEAFKINYILEYTEELKSKINEVNTVNKEIQNKIIKEKESLFNLIFKSKEERLKIIEENKNILFQEINKKKDQFMNEFNHLIERKKEIDEYVGYLKRINENLLFITEQITLIVDTLHNINNIKNKMIFTNFQTLKENLITFNASLTTSSAQNVMTMNRALNSMENITNLIAKIMLMFNNKIDYLLFNKYMDELEV